LKDPRIAALVVNSIETGSLNLDHYDLHAFAVMVNHVHILLTPKIAVPKITGSLKGATARAANLILRRTGRPFWQDESFDHWIRDDRDFMKTLHYIEHNPVAAGFVASPQDWPWSSACRNASKS